MTAWAIVRGRPLFGVMPGGYRVRLIVDGVPDEVPAGDVLAWLDDLDPQLDDAISERWWRCNDIDSIVEDAPRVRWRARPGRKQTVGGRAINVQLPERLLNALDDHAAACDETRSATIRRLIEQALP